MFVYWMQPLCKFHRNDSQSGRKMDLEMELALATYKFIIEYNAKSKGLKVI